MDTYKQENTMNNHKAWRFMNDKTVWYVESFDYSPNRKGDPYSYTSNADKALALTDAQCRKFCRYMADCGTVGFWS